MRCKNSAYFVIDKILLKRMFCGYLQRDLTAISNDLLLQQHIDASSLEMEDILYEIQDLDPAGIGARDLQECLLLQLQRKKPSPAVKIAKEILTNHFEEFSRKHYEKRETRY